MLHEAGLPWRLKDDTPVSAAGGILSKSGAYKIVPDFSDASTLKGGSFEVEDRQSLTPLGRAGAIYSKHKLPNENGFVVDEATETELAARGVARRTVSDNKSDIKLEARRDEIENIRGLKDPKSKARRDELESTGDMVGIMEVAARALHSKRHPDEDVDPDTEAMREMHRKDPPPDSAGHGERPHDAENSIGGTDSFEAILDANKTTRQRAIDAFGITACELASSRFRALLSQTADFLDNEAGEQRDTTATIPAPAQITQGNDIPFAFEDAAFTELEPVAVTIHR